MEFDSSGSPLSVARRLWSIEARDIPPEQFQSLVDWIYRSTDDLTTLWQLGGALDFYLRRRSGLARIPVGLTERLLRAANVEDAREMRVIGLKLVARHATPVPHIVDEIIRALQSDDEYEILGGLHETGELLDRCWEKELQFELRDFQHLVDCLRQLTSSPNEYTRATSERYLDRMSSQFGVFYP